MLRLKTLLWVALAAGSLGSIGGCVVRGQVSGGAYVEEDEPEMEVVSPGVYVVADYDYPVFYSEGFYWRYDNGIWLRSRVHTGGWARTTYVPGGVRRIDRPTVYVHYRGGGQVYRARRGGGGPVEVHEHRGRGPVRVHDHRH